MFSKPSAGALSLLDYARQVGEERQRKAAAEDEAKRAKRRAKAARRRFMAGVRSEVAKG